MQRQAAAKMDRRIGGSQAEIPKDKEMVREISFHPISSRTSPNVANPGQAV